MKEIEIFTTDGQRLLLTDTAMQYIVNGDEHALREDVAKALAGKLEVLSTWRDSWASSYDDYNVYILGNEDRYPEELGEGEVFGIGCCHFDLKNTNILRKWAGMVDAETKFWLNAIKKGFFAVNDVKRAIRSAPKEQAASMREAIKLFSQQPAKKVAAVKPAA